MAKAYHMKESEESVSGFSQNILIYILPAEEFLQDLRVKIAVSNFLYNFQAVATSSSPPRSVPRGGTLRCAFISPSMYLHEQQLRLLSESVHVTCSCDPGGFERRLPVSHCDDPAHPALLITTHAHSHVCVHAHVHVHTHEHTCAPTCTHQHARMRAPVS